MLMGMLVHMLVLVGVGRAVGVGVLMGMGVAVGMAVPGVVGMLVARAALVGVLGVVLVVVVGYVVLMHIFMAVLVIHNVLPLSLIIPQPLQIIHHAAAFVKARRGPMHYPTKAAIRATPPRGFQSEILAVLTWTGDGGIEFAPRMG